MDHGREDQERGARLEGQHTRILVQASTKGAGKLLDSEIGMACHLIDPPQVRQELQRRLQAALDVPIVNAQWDGDNIRLNNSVNLAFAVAVPNESGLDMEKLEKTISTAMRTEARPVRLPLRVCRI